MRHRRASAWRHPRASAWIVGIIGLGLMVAFSVYQGQAGSRGSRAAPGVPAGRPLHYFAAPLAASTLDGDANIAPPCTPARHDPRALNTCLLLRRAPLVLALFVSGAKNCVRLIDTIQALSRRFPPERVQFAALAVRAGHSQIEAIVRSHGWTIPVAYDRDGALGALFGVQACPMVELARRGGVVAQRLVGDHWLYAGALAARVRALLGR
ncbi:MAG: hypothetical protein ACR2OB_03420 [Solirubrobacteraceae bacterium]